MIWPDPIETIGSTEISWILEIGLGYRFISHKTKMNRSLWILLLPTVRAGSELNLIIMKFIQTINFKVRLNAFYWPFNEILLRNDNVWKLDWKTVFKSRSWARISNQFSSIILARIGSNGWKIPTSYRNSPLIFWEIIRNNFRATFSELSDFFLSQFDEFRF